MITITTANNETTLENDKAFCAYRIETEIDFDEDGYEVDGEQYVLIEKLLFPPRIAETALPAAFFVKPSLTLALLTPEWRFGW